MKNPSAVQQMQVRSLGQEDPLEEGMATLSSILAWRIPWSEELVGPQGHKESDMTRDFHFNFFAFTRCIILSCLY